MKTYKFPYLHVPTTFAVQSGIDKVEWREMEIQARNKKEAQKLFQIIMKVGK